MVSYTDIPQKEEGRDDTPPPSQLWKERISIGRWDLRAHGKQDSSAEAHARIHTQTGDLRGSGLDPEGTGLRHSSLGVNAAGSDDKHALIEGPSPALVSSEGLEDGGLGYSR